MEVRAAVSHLADRGWSVLSSQRLCDSPWLKVDREVVATPARPGGVEWLTAWRPLATVVAPKLPDGRYLLIRQERVSVRREMWEFPAGQVDDGDDAEAIIAAAHRELGEEAGVIAPEPLVPLGVLFSSCGFTNECCHLFLALNVEACASLVLRDEKEAIHDVRAFSPRELREAIAEGLICDANSLAVFARLQARGIFE